MSIPSYNVLTETDLWCLAHRSGKIHQVLAELPEYHKATHYTNPKDAFDGPLQFTNKNSDHYFAWLEKNPEVHKAFDLTMGIPRLSFGKEEWFDFFPVEDKLFKDTSDTEVLLVDVGGGRGHDLEAFHQKFPACPGRLILQDQPSVIDAITPVPSDIELLDHDFFSPQPIKGARAYYLRTVLHDWPDRQAKQILERIRDSMQDTSLLLIYELVVPDSGHELWHAQMDITLMASLASLERTKQQWVDLLDSAGLVLHNIWEPSKGRSESGSLLEVGLR